MRCMFVLQWAVSRLEQQLLARRDGTKQGRVSCAYLVHRLVNWRALFSHDAGVRRLLDLYGLTAFLRLAPLDDRGLFMRTLDRPVKAGDSIGLAHLQVPFHA